MDQYQQRKIAGALIQPAIKQRGYEHQRRDGPVAGESMHGGKEQGSNQIRLPSRTQARHEIGAEEPLFRKRSQQQGGEGKALVCRLPEQQPDARDRQGSPDNDMTRVTGHGRQYPSPVGQGKKKHESDEDVLAARVRKSGAAREDCAADPWNKALNQDLIC